jgi:peptidyl-prolyl cis-trans isomerase SurA
MFKKNFLFSLIFFVIFYSNQLYSNINIVLQVNNEILTNYDIQKEIGYLKILNPNLKQLDNNQILKISKEALINEIIKKKEISNFSNFTNNDKLVEKYLNDLILKINLKDTKDLEKQLILNNSYSINDIKKKIEIDLMWNELIVIKYKNQVYVDKEKIIKKIDEIMDITVKELLLSEIVFVKKENLTIEEYINQINSSIYEIGFENSANIFSISESSKFGGKIGWVDKNSLSNKISEKLINTKIGDITEPVQIGNSYLILKVNDIRNKKVLLDKEEEFQRLSNADINEQLSKFSTIYFNKSKNNYKISEF